MKQKLLQLLASAIDTLKQQGTLPLELTCEIQIDNSRDKTHGDFASNVALMLAKSAKAKPRDLADVLVRAIPADPVIKSIAIAGPGFINFFLEEDAVSNIITKILTEKDRFGFCHKHNGQSVNIEFISANPTGPLHVGHGRGAAYGATVADLLQAVGYKVDREYYVNDAGRQMNILATSVWLRYLQLFNHSFDFPRNAYKGAYVIGIAENLKQQYGDKFVRGIPEIFDAVPQDETDDGQGDKEAHIDGLIVNAKKLLQNDYEIIFNLALKTVLDDIKEDCSAFGIHYQNWFSEKSLETSGAVSHAIDALKKNGHLYEREGALWFNSCKFGDDKDRVVVRDNGQTTYFASDLAYLLNKIERGYDKIIVTIQHILPARA